MTRIYIDGVYAGLIYVGDGSRWDRSIWAEDRRGNRRAFLNSESARRWITKRFAMLSRLDQVA